MDKRMMLLNAANAMGFKVLDYEDDGFGVCYDVEDGFGFWNPLELSADCAEMEDVKNISTQWEDGYITCMAWYEGLVYSHTCYFTDHATKGAARRYASTMVAAMIGEKM